MVKLLFFEILHLYSFENQMDKDLGEGMKDKNLHYSGICAREAGV